MAEKVSAGDSFSLGGSVAGRQAWPGSSKQEQDASRMGAWKGNELSPRTHSWNGPLSMNFLWLLSSFMGVSRPHLMGEKVHSGVFYTLQSPERNCRNTMETVCCRFAFCLRITLHPTGFLPITWLEMSRQTLHLEASLCYTVNSELWYVSPSQKRKQKFKKSRSSPGLSFQHLGDGGSGPSLAV